MHLPNAHCGQSGAGLREAPALVGGVAGGWTRWARRFADETGAAKGANEHGSDHGAPRRAHRFNVKLDRLPRTNRLVLRTEAWRTGCAGD